MSAAIVRYYEEPEGWWAETDALPTFSAAGDSYAEVRRRVHDSLPELIGAPVEIYDDLSSVGAAMPVIYGPIHTLSIDISLHSSLTGRGSSSQRGPVSSGVGKFESHPSGLSTNPRLEFA